MSNGRIIAVFIGCVAVIFASGVIFGSLVQMHLDHDAQMKKCFAYIHMGGQLPPSVC